MTTNVSETKVPPDYTIDHQKFVVTRPPCFLCRRWPAVQQEQEDEEVEMSNLVDEWNGDDVRFSSSFSGNGGARGRGGGGGGSGGGSGGGGRSSRGSPSFLGGAFDDEEIREPV